MASNFVAIILFIALFVAGFGMTFDAVDWIYPSNSLGLGFEDITSVISGFWVLVVKAVGIALMGLSVFVIKGIISEG